LLAASRTVLTAEDLVFCTQRRVDGKWYFFGDLGKLPYSRTRLVEGKGD
jgi:hypothetical protein